MYVNHLILGSWTNLPHPVSCASLIFQQKKVANYWFERTKPLKIIFQSFIFILATEMPYWETHWKVQCTHFCFCFSDIKQLNRMNKTSQPVSFQSVYTLTVVAGHQYKFLCYKAFIHQASTMKLHTYESYH